MKNNLFKKSLLAFGMIAAAAVSSLAQAKADSIDAVMKKFNELGQFNGSVLVAENGRVIYKKGFGMANMEWNIPNAPDTKFRLASITKQFTAAVILKLVEQGKLKLDGRITEYLPDYRKDTGDRITIHQLLNHTSGIPNYTAQPRFFAESSRTTFQPADFVKKFASGDLEFEPGTKFNYNNSAYFILGAIIEKVTGQPYARNVRDHIFVPAGMTSSGYDWSTTVIKNRASGYGRGPNGGYVNVAYLDMSIPYSAGSLYSTVEDMYLWDQALYGDKVLTPKSKELMFKANLQDYGYGVEIKNFTLADKKAVPTIRHNGGIHGFSTEMVRFIADKHLIVLLDNTEGGGFQPAMISAIGNILYGQAYEMPKKSIGELVGKTITEKGVEAGIKLYRDMKAKNDPEYSFDEGQLNEVGYTLARGNKPADALEIFKLNVEMFPNAANPHDSLGEFYARAGQKDLAIKMYKRALEIDPKFESSMAGLKQLETPAAAVDAKVMASYVGRYEIVPQFVLEITLESGKLYGQATGQQKFPLEPISESRFAVPAVRAELSFHKDDKGSVTHLVLHQGGREQPGKRLP